MVSTVVAAVFVVISVVLGSSNGDSVCLVPPRNTTLSAGICMRVKGIWYQCADFGGGVLKYQKIAVTTCEQNGKIYNLFDSYVAENVRYTCAVTPDGSKTFISTSGCVTDKGTFIKKNEVVEECLGEGFKCEKFNGLYRLHKLSPTPPSTTTTTAKPISGVAIRSMRLVTRPQGEQVSSWEDCIKMYKERSNCAAFTFNAEYRLVNYEAKSEPHCFFYEKDMYGIVCEGGWDSWWGKNTFP